MKHEQSFGAFTLIELLVVMGIIGGVMVLGVWGMISLQRTVELQQAITDVNAILKETRSKAENNVFPAEFTNASGTGIDTNDLYAYRIKFNNSDLTHNYISRQLCQRDTQDIENPDDDTWDCTIYTEADLKAKDIFTDIKYEQVGTEVFCSSILFVNLTGEVLLDTGTDAESMIKVDNIDECQVMIKHDKSDKGVILRVNNIDNEYSIDSLK